MNSCIKTLRRGLVERVAEYQRILMMPMGHRTEKDKRERADTLCEINRQIKEHRELIELLMLTDYERQIA